MNRKAARNKLTFRVRKYIDMSSNLFAKLSFAKQDAMLLLNVPFAAEEHVFEMINKTRIDRIPLPDEHYEFIVAFVHNVDQVASYKEYLDQHQEDEDTIWMVIKDGLIPELQQQTIWKKQLVQQHPIPVMKGWKAFTYESNHTASKTGDGLKIQEH